MSLTRSYRAVPDERLLRQLRITAQRKRIESNYSVFGSIMSRAGQLQVVKLLAANPAWEAASRRADELAASGRSDDDETELTRVEAELSALARDADSMLARAYEQEMERQRIEAALRKAQAALESATTAITAAAGDALVKKWLGKRSEALQGQLRMIQKLVQERSYDTVPARCDELKGEAVSLAAAAQEEEAKYAKATEIRDRIVKSLRALGISRVKLEEVRDGELFSAHVIRAKDSYGRGVKSVVEKSGSVKDEFLGYDGHNCVGAVDGYQRLLKDRFGVRMQDATELAHDGRPLLRTKEEMDLPRGTEESLER